MSRGPVRSLIRIVFVALALTAVLSLAACGSDDVQTLTFTLEGSGKDSRFTGPPKSADPGEAKIELVNDTDKEGELQLVRVEGGHSDQEVANGLKNAIEGKPLPIWFFAAGGVGPVPAGEAATVTQVLKPGVYYPYNVEAGTVKPKIKVSGEESSDQLEGEPTVTAVDYGYKADGLSAGSEEILFENTGAEPHHLLASPLVGDSTAEDVERYFKTEKGKAPLDQKATQTTAVIEGGESQLVTLDLEPGRYAFYCFVTDREGGPPHALKGMVDEVEVE